MITEIAKREPCSHPELNMTSSIGAAMERVYWCSRCKKNVAIPACTLVEHGQEGLAGIIGLTFGQKWEQVARRGQI